MGAKEDRLRDLRRKLFYRDGWQDEHGKWFAMCGNGCDNIVSWATAGTRKRDPEGRFTLDNTFVACRQGCPVERQRDRERQRLESA